MQDRELPGLDRIEIKDLLVRGIVGINPQEREKAQDILINVVMHVDVRTVAERDAVDAGVNYRTVTKAIIALVEQEAFYTVEKLATEIARVALAGGRVPAVTVSVEKPGALRFARSVGVVITRTAAEMAP